MGSRRARELPIRPGTKLQAGLSSLRLRDRLAVPLGLKKGGADLFANDMPVRTAKMSMGWARIGP